MELFKKLEGFIKLVKAEKDIFENRSINISMAFIAFDCINKLGLVKEHVKYPYLMHRI